MTHNHKKYTKKKQSGGTSINIEQIRSLIEFLKAQFKSETLIFDTILTNMNSIYEEYRKKFPMGEKTPFRYDYNIPQSDSFKTIFETPFEWYLSKNPNFRPIEELTITIPEFSFIVNGMIKDLLVLYIGRKMPQILAYEKEKYGENSLIYGSMPPTYHTRSQRLYKIKEDDPRMDDIIKKAFELMIIGGNVINKDYNYVLFVNFLIEYSRLFSLGTLNVEDNSNLSNSQKEWNCKEAFKFVTQTLKTPYILLPTLGQINYVKMLDLIKAPIVNFRLMNNRRILHDAFEAPCEEFLHDIRLHGDVTHNIFHYIKNLKKYREKASNSTLDGGKFKKLYFIKNQNFNMLKKYYTYDQSIIDSNKNNHTYDEENTTRFYNSVILFQVLHEIQYLYIFIDTELTVLEIIDILARHYYSTSKILAHAFSIGCNHDITIGDKKCDSLLNIDDLNRLFIGIDREHHLLKDLPLRTFVNYISELINKLFALNSEILSSIESSSTTLVNNRPTETETETENSVKNSKKLTHRQRRKAYLKGVQNGTIPVSEFRKRKNQQRITNSFLKELNRQQSHSQAQPIKKYLSGLNNNNINV